MCTVFSSAFKPNQLSQQVSENSVIIWLPLLCESILCIWVIGPCITYEYHTNMDMVLMLPMCD